MRYNPFTGTWRFSLGLGGPLAWAGIRYPYVGGRPWVSAGVGGWWGGVGTSHHLIDVHHNLDFNNHVNRNTTHNVYSRHPEALAPVHSHLPEHARVSGPEERASGHVYTDHEGNPYRKSPEGDWERRTPQTWERAAPTQPHQVPRFEPQHRELEQRDRARTNGIDRARNYQQHSQQQQSPRPAPGPRSSGGGPRR